MKIGIDFGTSYSAAAAMVDGKPQSILFSEKPEFRTAVFFSHEVDDSDVMVMTPALERDLAVLLKTANADQKRALREHQSRSGTGVRPLLRSAEQLRTDAIGILRRQWMERRRQQAQHAAPSTGKAIFGAEAFEAY